MKVSNLIFICFCLLLSRGHMEGKDGQIQRKLEHKFTLEVHPSLNLPTHGYYRGYNEYDTSIPAAGSIHLKYGFSLSPQTKPGSLFPNAYQGLGIGAQSFFHHDMTGTPLMLYIFQGCPLVDLSKDITLGYEWNLGASYGWKINQVISSRWNVYINVYVPFTWSISPEWKLSAGPEFTHFSNGDTSFPNGGANTVGLRIGITAAINQTEQHSAAGSALIRKDKTPFKQRIGYDLILSGGWRAGRQLQDSRLEIFNRVFPTAGLTFNPLFRFNRYFSAGPALDIIYDRSTDISESKRFIDQTASGLSVKGELTMPFFSVNIGAGYGLSSSIQLKGFYTSYTLKTFLSNKLFLSINYRLSSRQYCHNLMFGLGIRL